MRLVIGGFAQGKLEWLLEESGISPQQVADGAVCTRQEAGGAAVLDHLHLFIRRLLEHGEEPRAAVMELAEGSPELVFICDEIGGGVVPIEPFERRWREETGRICCMLARRAQRVDRVFCGIGVTIKRDGERQK